MICYLPKYDTVVPHLAETLSRNFGMYDRRLYDAVYEQLLYPKKKFGSAPVDVQARKHAKKIIEVMDLRDVEHVSAALGWFQQSMYQEGKEYALIKGRWYARTWKKITLTKPTHKFGVVFWQDYNPKTEAAGMSIMLTQTSARLLAYGRGLEAQSKRIASEAHAKVKHLKTHTDDDSIKARLKMLSSIDDRQIRERPSMIRDAVKEILGYTHLLAFSGAVTAPDFQYFRKRGLDDLRDALRLVVFQTRHAEKPVEMLECDGRTVRPTYDSSESPHNAVAAGLFRVVQYYANAEKL